MTDVHCKARFCRRRPHPRGSSRTQGEGLRVDKRITSPFPAGMLEATLFPAPLGSGRVCENSGRDAQGIAPDVPIIPSHPPISPFPYRNRAITCRAGPTGGSLDVLSLKTLGKCICEGLQPTVITVSLQHSRRQQNIFKFPDPGPRPSLFPLT